jgi:hypothetical protein
VAYDISGLVQEVAFSQFRGNANHRGQHFAKIFGRIGLTPENIAIDAGFGDMDFVRPDACEGIDHA